MYTKHDFADKIRKTTISTNNFKYYIFPALKSFQLIDDFYTLFVDLNMKIIVELELELEFCIL